MSFKQTLELNKFASSMSSICIKEESKNKYMTFYCKKSKYSKRPIFYRLHTVLRGDVISHWNGDKWIIKINCSDFRKWLKRNINRTPEEVLDMF